MKPEGSWNVLTDHKMSNCSFISQYKRSHKSNSCLFISQHVSGQISDVVGPAFGHASSSLFGFPDVHQTTVLEQSRSINLFGTEWIRMGTIISNIWNRRIFCWYEGKDINNPGPDFYNYRNKGARWNCMHVSEFEPQWISNWSYWMMYIGKPKSHNPYYIWWRNEAYCPIIML